MALKPSTHQDLVKTGLPRKGENLQGNDQLAVDLEAAKKAKEKLVSKVKETFSPTVTQGVEKVSTITTPLKGMFSGELPKKIIRIAAITILLIVLLYILSLLVAEIRQNGDVIISGVPTPTVAPYLPYNPSIYAEDELVLQLEEDIKVLDRELSTVRLKENILTPPVLDFNVNFEE